MVVIEPLPLRQTVWSPEKSVRISLEIAENGLNFATLALKLDGESVLPNASCELCSLFLCTAFQQSGFTDYSVECNAIARRSYGESDLTLLSDHRPSLSRRRCSCDRIPVFLERNCGQSDFERIKTRWAQFTRWSRLRG